MKACGISLYRVALPMLGVRACWPAATLFVLEQTILGPCEPASRRRSAT